MNFQLKKNGIEKIVATISNLHNNSQNKTVHATVPIKIPLKYKRLE
jgi:hypothetical protein